jgi:hypothetical protein
VHSKRVNTPIILKDNESNLIWAAKHWFAPKEDSKIPITEQMRYERWWKEIGAVYNRVYLYKPNIEGIHHFVQETWFSICSKLPYFQRLFNELLVDSLPANSWKFAGAPKVSQGIWDERATYNSKQIMMARVAAMMSQLSLLSIHEITLAPRWEHLDVDGADIYDILS